MFQVHGKSVRLRSKEAEDSLMVRYEYDASENEPNAEAAPSC